jgi:glutaryl-CoA dehydrogenase
MQNTRLASLDFDLGPEIDMLRATVRAFAEDRVAPLAAEIDRTDRFPVELWPQMGALGLHGITVEEEYGGAGMGYLAHCVAMEEVSRASASVGLSYGAHSNLCINQIRRNGSEAQKRHYLPKLISGEHVGALAMSEPDAGSDVVAMRLRADKKGDRFVLNGTKLWITNGSVADVAVVWAKGDDGEIGGYLVEKGTPGYSTLDIHGKFSMRASITSELAFADCRIPLENKLPGVKGLKGPLSCLSQARYGIAWGAIGAAMGCYDWALQYAQQRIQFNKPIGSFQLVQQKLVWMINEITKAQLLCWRLGQIKDAGKVRPQQISLAKMNNVQMALDTARLARDILGAAGIVDEHPIIRHLMNLETVNTYEGTHDIHILIVGRDITGLDAFGI